MSQGIHLRHPFKASEPDALTLHGWLGTRASIGFEPNFLRHPKFATFRLAWKPLWHWAQAIFRKGTSIDVRPLFGGLNVRRFRPTPCKLKMTTTAYEK